MTKSSDTEPATDREILMRLTLRTIQFTYHVFNKRVNGEPSTTAEIAKGFKDCTDDLAASVLFEAKDAGALTLTQDDEWRVTQDALHAMRVYYREWSEVVSPEDEEKGLR